MKLDESSKLSTAEINRYLAEGARFVRYTYVISIVVMTFKRESDIFFSYVRMILLSLRDGLIHCLASFWAGGGFLLVQYIQSLLLSQTLREGM